MLKNVEKCWRKRQRCFRHFAQVSRSVYSFMIFWPLFLFFRVTIRFPFWRLKCEISIKIRWYFFDFFRFYYSLLFLWSTGLLVCRDLSLWLLALRCFVQCWKPSIVPSNWRPFWIFPIFDYCYLNYLQFHSISFDFIQFHSISSRIINFELINLIIYSPLLSLLIDLI